MNILKELHTIRDLIRYACTCFHEAEIYFGHGTDNAWDEAVALILHTLHIPYEHSGDAADAKLTTKEKEHILALIDYRINERIPVAYLINEAWFAGLPFYVDERVLIPRSPIAELIETQFSPWVNPENVKTILDLCTGSGCIAVACAKAFPTAHVDASDLSEEALAVAGTNIALHQLEDQITLHQSDLFDNLPSQKYDIIVSNPPYVDKEDMESLPEEYHHEPRLGLAAGDDGLTLVKRILKSAKKYLNEGGILIVEVGNSEYALAEQFPNIPFTWLTFQRGGGGVFLLTAEQLNTI